MKLSKLFVIALLAGALGVIGCNDDTTDTGNGGDFNFDTACDRGVCLESAAAKAQCEALVAACRTEPEVNQDECIILITEKCDGG
jgi:predicted small secreted protein